jgi:hypothetical protein
MCLERVKGIEPSYEAWEAAVLPLNYTREAVDDTSGHRAAMSARQSSWQLEFALGREANGAQL